MYTFGHGESSSEELASLLTGVGIKAVVDVRRFPGSRRNPAAALGRIEAMTQAIDVAYRHDERLGGRRSLSKEEDEVSPDAWWQVRAFRAYSAWTRTDAFHAGLADLVAQLDDEPDTAVMCSESMWWRCHRRIIADVLLLEHGIKVEHVMPSGRLATHEPAEGARLVDGHVVWDNRGVVQSLH